MQECRWIYMSDVDIDVRVVYSQSTESDALSAKPIAVLNLVNVTV